MKKGLLVGVFFGVMLLSFIASVSAADLAASAQNLVDQVKAVVTPIANFAFGTTEGWDTLFVKILIFVVLMIILVYTLEKMPLVGDSNGIVWTLGIIIGILAMRLITTQALLEFIWLPSGVVGMAIVTLLPLVIYFYFIESFPSKFIRRTGWILFCVLFVGLALARWNTLKNTEGVVGFNLGWLYLIVAGLSILSFLLDGTIQRWRRKSAAENVAQLHGAQMRGKIARMRKELEDDVFNGLRRDSADYKARDDHIKYLEKKYI